jgi:hypothetical protein
MLIKISFQSGMRLSWPQHLELSRTVERAAVDQRGMALALMGVSLLMLTEDLLETETEARICPEA